MGINFGWDIDNLIILHGEKVEVEDIIYIKSEGNHSRFYLESQDETILLTKTLKISELHLQKHSFFRVSRGLLINLDHVVGYDEEEISWVKLSNGEHFPVAFRRRKKFNELMENS